MKIFLDFFKKPHSLNEIKSIENLNEQGYVDHLRENENRKNVPIVQRFLSILSIQKNIFNGQGILEDEVYFDRKIVYDIRVNSKLVSKIFLCVFKKVISEFKDELGWYIKVVKVLIIVVTVKKVDNFAYEIFTTGTVKKVLTRIDDKDHVYFIPLKNGLFGKLMEVFHENELREEIKIVREIDERFKEKGIEGTHVVHDFEEVSEKAYGLYTIRSSKATCGDLDKFIKKRKITFPAILKIVLQVVQAVSELHIIDFVQGDIKPENMLVFGTEENPIVKLSDFGKAKKLKKKQKTNYLGTSRFAPWECTLSKKGEISSIGLVAILLFENQFLTKDSPVLVHIDKKDQKASDNDVYKRRGIERFVSQNKYFPQTEQSGLLSFIRVLLQRVCPEWEKIIFKTDPKMADEHLGMYIDVLVNKIKVATPGISEVIDQLGALLKSMTQSDPLKRPNAEKVKADFEALVKELDKENAWVKNRVRADIFDI